MVTEEAYLEAKRIIELYKAEQDQLFLEKKQKLIQQQREREENCPEHYFSEDGKWTSTKSCQFCGKTII